jgi:hypothetical protein
MGWGGVADGAELPGMTAIGDAVGVALLWAKPSPKMTGMTMSESVRALRMNGVIDRISPSP